jgi:hypothetical protein
MKKSGRISLHFEGDIVFDHKVTARTLGKSLVHTQNAIDRAYLDLKRGNLWKYARMHGDDYSDADFLTLYPEEGGFLQELFSEKGKDVVDRLSSAITPAMNEVNQQGQEAKSSLSSQVENRRNQIQKGILEPIDFQDFVEKPDDKVVRKYADRAINREIDQILSIIRSQHAGKSNLVITTIGKETSKYDFNKSRSVKFHAIVARREIGTPVLYAAKVRQLDLGMLNGKVVNVDNDVTMTISFSSEDDFLKAHPYLASQKEMIFIGAPLIEYGAFDPNAGDVYFIDVYK